MGRQAGGQVVLMTRPFVGPVVDRNKWKNFAFDYNAATVEVAQAEGVPVVDLYSEFKGRDDYFSDESHFTSAGHDLAARIVLTELQPVIAAATGELP